MKKIFVVASLILVVFAAKHYSQGRKEEDKPRIPMERIEQLEKAKLIEILDLNEETAIRFFARRNEYREQQRELFTQRDNTVRKIEKKIKEESKLSDKECREQLNDLLEIEKKLVNDKKKFFKSLNDILTPEQILKLAVFDNRFMKEIKEFLIGRPRGKQDRQLHK